MPFLISLALGWSDNRKLTIPSRANDAYVSPGWTLAVIMIAFFW